MAVQGAQVSWADATVAIAAVVQAVVVVGALIYAHHQWREARALREAQGRPFVVVDFDVLRIRKVIHLVIKNHGSSIARDVKFSFTPELDSTIDDEHGSLRKLRILTEGIPTLAPGAEIPLVFDWFEGRGDDRADVYDVLVSYRGEAGHHYEERLLLDLGVWRNIEYIDRKDIHHVAKSLDELVKLTKRWSAGMSGLHIRTDADLEQERSERQRRRDERPT